MRNQATTGCAAWDHRLLTLGNRRAPLHKTVPNQCLDATGSWERFNPSHLIKRTVSRTNVNDDVDAISELWQCHALTAVYDAARRNSYGIPRKNSRPDQGE
jgi:hypothetical protein